MTAWLGYIARNCIRTVLRRSGRDEAVGTAENFDGQMLTAFRNVGSSPLPDEILQRRETRELVAVTLSKLRCEYRQVLIDRYYEQHPVRAIAQSRGITEGAVKSLLHRARQAFKVAFVSSAEAIMQDAECGGRVR
jgi:RNA polymerase sigma factor (sigma-70 family)